MNYKLIATDMDGTLLDEEHGITKENIEAIVKVQREKGVKFVLASGRPSYAMLEYAKELQMDKYEGYVLAFNGGELIDMKTNEVIFHEGLEKKDIENVYKVSKQLYQFRIRYNCFKNSVYLFYSVYNCLCYIFRIKVIILVKCIWDCSL